MGNGNGNACKLHFRGHRVEGDCRVDEEKCKGRGWFRNELFWEIKLLEERAQELATAREETQPPSLSTDE